MCASKVIGFGENAATATYADGLAFIERTRRQLDRFEEAVPHVQGKGIAPEEAAEIRRLCDELEASIRKDIGDI
jgi:hypothetical protein